MDLDDEELYWTRKQKGLVTEAETERYIKTLEKQLENLLKERQEDKERIKELEKELEEQDMQHDLELIGKEEYTKEAMGEIIEHYYTANEDCIPKSLIKKRIKKYETYIEESRENAIHDSKIPIYRGYIRLLKEILGGEK